MPTRMKIPEPEEPAHPMIVELDELLRSLYKFIRDKYQDVINQAFDHASRDIGFVVATTMPMTFEVGDKGQLKGFAVPESSSLKGTLLDRTITQSLKGKLEGAIPIVKPGAYTIYLIWPPALRLKLFKEWMEPAHLARPMIDRARLAAVQQVPGLVWESHEPAHWFNPGIAISAEEALHVSLLDETYPELRLMDRVVSARRAMPQLIPPEVQEPAHFRQIIETIPELPKEMLAELAQVLRRYGF